MKPPLESPVRLLALDAGSYQTHDLHASSRVWTETNCYVDLWIEVLHALGLDPLAGAAFVLSADFACDQWTFIKYPPEDLRQIYGIDVAEMAVWRPLLEHAYDHIAAGRLITAEVDSWWLPDSRGTAYRSQHVKTTIVPEGLDVGQRRMAYFHNAGYFVLDGDDFDGVFTPSALPPYVEDVNLTGLARAAGRADAELRALARSHLERRPADNPVTRMGNRITSDLEWLATAGLEVFHEYAFVTVRQFGATAELAGSYVDWLGHRLGRPLADSAAAFYGASAAAKTLEFTLARAARGRAVDLHGPLAAMASGWEQGVQAVDERLG